MGREDNQREPKPPAKPPDEQYCNATLLYEAWLSDGRAGVARVLREIEAQNEVGKQPRPGRKDIADIDPDNPIVKAAGSAACRTGSRNSRSKSIGASQKGLW